MPRAGVSGQKGAVCPDSSLRKVASPLQPASEMSPKSHLAEVPGQGGFRQADVLPYWMRD